MKKIIIIFCFIIMCLFTNTNKAYSNTFPNGLGFLVNFNPYIGLMKTDDMSWGVAINYELGYNLGRVFFEYGGAFGTRKVKDEQGYQSSFPYLPDKDVYSHVIKLGYDYIWRFQTESTTAFFFGLGVGGGVELTTGNAIRNEKKAFAEMTQWDTPQNKWDNAYPKGLDVGFLLRVPMQIGFNFDDSFLLYLEFTPNFVFGTATYITLPIGIGLTMALP